MDYSSIIDTTSVSDKSRVKMSTMTVDAMITNVRFDKETAINGLTLTKDIVEIGCNYGHLIDETYKTMDIYKDRVKKRETDAEATNDQRKKQGLGTHFNSQITFTAICNTTFDDENPLYHTYQIKLFTNGRVQIPGLGPLNQDKILNKLFDIIIGYIKLHPQQLMFRDFMEVKIKNLSPILKNYVSITLGEDDCPYEPRPFVNKHGENAFAEPMIDLQILEPIFTEYKTKRGLPIYLNSAIFNPQRYAAMRVKFSTPQIITGSYSMDKFIEMAKLYYQQKTRLVKVKPVMLSDSDTKMERVVKMMQNAWAHNNKSLKKHKQKQTTVKVFKSGKINIDHANTTHQAEIIRDVIVQTINQNLEQCLYYDYPQKRIHKLAKKPVKKRASVESNETTDLAIEQVNEDVANHQGYGHDQSALHGEIAVNDSAIEP